MDHLGNHGWARHLEIWALGFMVDFRVENWPGSVEGEIEGGGGGAGAVNWQVTLGPGQGGPSQPDPTLVPFMSSFSRLPQPI